MPLITERKPFLTSEAVAQRELISLRTLQDLVRRDAIPYLRRPSIRRLAFSLEHLEAWEAGAELEAIDLPGGGRLVRPVET